VRGAGLPLRVAGIRKSYGTGLALDGITLDLAPGAFNTLLGPSGCGKTTLLRIVAGFVEPDEGRVYIGGEDRTDAPAWKRRIGFVFQSYALWPHMSVFDNVAYGLRLRRLSRDEVADRVGKALGAMDLAGAGARHPGQLSGGQQQRVALARALVLEPEVLLLDEPLSSLDARLRVEMRRQIRAVQRAAGITTLYVTHDQEEALELSDYVVVMSRGRVEQVGAPQEVYRRPQSAAVATFLGTVTLLEGEALPDGSLAVGGQRLPLALPAGLAGGTVRVALRPEDVEMHEDAAEGRLAGTVRECAFLGHAFRTRVGLAEGPELVAYSRTALQPGQRVWLRARGGAVIP
jgi:ABC-type Fe3+/spermidine/putrescine transport system ATPase subunit